MLLFDIVIPTYNNLAELKKCLHCFEKQTITSFHVWVCVDGSTDGTVTFLQQTHFHFPVSVLQHADQKNHGRSAARNLSLPHLSARYLLFLDSDFTFSHDYLEQHLTLLSKINCISLGAIRYDSGSIWRDYDVTRGLHRYSHGAKVPFKYLVTANLAMPVELFSSVNGFDENISSYGGEDTDLGCTIEKKYPQTIIIFNEKAAVQGHLNKSLSFALQQREAFARTNLKYLVSKHPEAKTLFRVDVLQSLRGHVLYAFLPPQQALVSLAQCKWLPGSFRIKLVHLLVFYHTYKGFYKD